MLSNNLFISFLVDIAFLASQFCIKRKKQKKKQTKINRDLLRSRLTNPFLSTPKPHLVIASLIY